MSRQLRYAEWLVIVLAIGVALWGMREVRLGDSLASRLATTWSLTQAGAWQIDQPDNPFTALTVDKFELDGRIYSTKPPVLPLLITAEYGVMDALVGVDLNDREELRFFIQVLTFTFNILPFLLLLCCFRGILYRLKVPDWTRLYALFALALATQLAGFASQFNNHIPAVGFLVLAMYCTLRLTQHDTTGNRAGSKGLFFLFGLAGGLVYTIDLPLTIFIVFLGLYLLWRHPKHTVLWGGLGMLLPLGVNFGVMAWVTGTPLPVQMRPELYLYEASYWRNPMGLDALHEPKGTYLFHMTLGRHGVLLLYPVLLFGVIAACLAPFVAKIPARGYILAAAAAILILFTYYVTRTNNYGGAAYGFRWAMGAMPILLLMGTPVISYLFKSQWGRVVLALLLLVSMYSAYECHQSPWGENLEWSCRWVFGPNF